MALRMKTFFHILMFNKAISQINNKTIRWCCTDIKLTKLVIQDFGDPTQVVTLEKEFLTEPNEDEVVVEMLAAPVNPADINCIQGVYPVKPKLPGVAGNEGVGKVIFVGREVKDLQVDDLVIPNWEAFGTWRTHGIFRPRKLFKVSRDVGILELATMSVNMCTAYRMLKDFVDLCEGDVVIQNGANSGVGQVVIQLCRAWGFKTVNIIRERPDLKTMRKYLKSLGADYVLTEEELRSTTIFKNNECPAPRLALNCIGGKNAVSIMKHMVAGSSMITYGGMSRQPLTAATSSLIFKDLRFYGFWMTKWTRENRDSAARQKMFEDLQCLVTENMLTVSRHKLVPIEDYKKALSDTLNPCGFLGEKYIFDFRPKTSP